MRLKTFQANDGDCLLLSSNDNRHMLIDGGRSGSFAKHVAPNISELDALDVVCISHIDADHITGILTMLENEVDWRIHLHEKKNTPDGRAPKPKPNSPKPPKIGEIWHNGFGDQLGDEATGVSDLLSLGASVQQSFSNPDMLPRHSFLIDLTLGERQAIELSDRIGARQLDIPLNKSFKGKLILAGRKASRFDLGETTLQVIGPFKSDVTKLREEWGEWVQKNGSAISKIQEEMEADASRLGASEAGIFLANTRFIQSSSGQFGDRDGVSTPNLASIMLLAEDTGGTVLMTGDGSSDDIEKGLKNHGKLDGDGQCHVDVLKVPHHGAIANVSKSFFKNVIADHYVFCGNGSHSNPEIKVVELLVESRLGTPGKRSKHAKVEKPFHLHFNCTPALAGTENRRKHMEALVEIVESLVQSSFGKMTGTFHSSSFFDINI